MMALDYICKVSEELIFRMNIPEVLWPSLLHAGFLLLQTGAGGWVPSRGTWVSHCGAFSCCGAQALGTQASVAATGRLSCKLLASVVVTHGP